MTGQTWERVPIDAQSVEAPLSQAAVFLVVAVEPDDRALAHVRETLATVDDLIKTVGFRDLAGRLSCVVGVGHDIWRRLAKTAQMPAELHPFKPIVGAKHQAPATPGDLLFHIRAERVDLCFEFERLLLAALGEAVRVVDAVSGFRYFDARDLLGFVDGTANPAGHDIPAAALVGEEDPDFAGGSYVVVQKYLHDMTGWNAAGASAQEEIIGRTKVDNVELPDAGADAQKSHKTLSTIVDEDEIGKRPALLEDLAVPALHHLVHGGEIVRHRRPGGVAPCPAGTQDPVLPVLSRPHPPVFAHDHRRHGLAALNRGDIEALNAPRQGSEREGGLKRTGAEERGQGERKTHRSIPDDIAQHNTRARAVEIARSEALPTMW